MIKLLKQLSELNAASGREAGVTDFLKNKLKEYGDVTVDTMGNVMCSVGRDSDRHILIEAHIDEIGLVVTHIDSKGFLKVSNVGGVDRRMLAAQEVTVLGKQPVFGIITSMPPHLSKGEDKKFTPVDEIAVDIGMKAEQAAEAVSIGDRIVFNGKFCELKNGFVSGKAFDDRAGAAVLITVLQMLKGEDLPYRVTALFSTQEEVGTRGAKAAAYGAGATEAIAVDVSFAHTPDSDKEKCGVLGGGPMIGFSPVLSLSVTERLISTAESESIPYQREIMGGATSTDADVIAVTKAGVPCALLSVPLRYMHTAAETLCVGDVKNTAKLMAAYIRKA